MISKPALLILSLSVAAAVQAQRVSHDFHNVAMPEALRLLGDKTNRYTINFIYNDLEDFRVSASVKNQPIPAAIRQLIGFYPIAMTMPTDSIISVECIQKTLRRYKGRVTDEHGQPAEFANIALLSPADSTVIAGGVSNADGYFVIPCELPRVIARITYVGYKPISRAYDSTDMGVVRLQPEATTVKGVVVKGNRPQYRMVTGGTEVAVENTLLAKEANTLNVLALLPRVAVDGQKIEVLGKGSPLVYINNKRVADNEEIQRLSPADIKSISVITSPGAEYNAEVESVIRIRTKNRHADGLSLRAVERLKYNKWLTDLDQLTTSYQTKKLELTNTVYTMLSRGDEDNHLITDLQTGGKRYRNTQHSLYNLSNRGINEYFAADYALNDSNSIGTSYRYYGTLRYRCRNNDSYNVMQDDIMQGNIASKGSSSNGTHLHNAELYYAGKFGKVALDFNATYYTVSTRRTDSTHETSTDLGDRDVNSSSLQNSNMWAAKFVASMPIGGRGTVSVGTEISRTHSHGTFDNREGLVEASNTDIRERNVAAFAQYRLSPGAGWSIDLGMRYENIARDYFSFGVKQDDVSRRYSNFFPNLTISWRRRDLYLQLNLNEKTHRPSYRELRNFKQYDNRYLYEGGNPELQPEKVFNVETSLVYKWMNAAVGYKYTDNTIEWTKYVYPQQAVAYSTSLNFNHNQLLYASLSLSPQLGIYRPVLKLGYDQQFFDTRKYGARRALTKPRMSCYMANRLLLTGTLGATLTFNGTTGVADGFLMYRGNCVVNLQLDKSFAHRRWTVYLSANDIFKTSKERWTMYGIGTESIKNCYYYTRSVSLQIVYNFNAKRSKYRGTGAGNEEKSRL